MRTSPYPIPPSRTWLVTTLITYAALALAGGIVLAVLASSPQSVEGLVVLGLWGGITLVSSSACVYGVARSRYRYEWMGAWGIVLGTSIYLAVTLVGTITAGIGVLIQSAPTILVFLYAIGLTLARAIQLGLRDLQAREQVLTEQAVTGEIPEVSE